jgi:hypothetical protein
LPYRSLAWMSLSLKVKEQQWIQEIFIVICCIKFSRLIHLLVCVKLAYRIFFLRGPRFEDLIKMIIANKGSRYEGGTCTILRNVPRFVHAKHYWLQYTT